MSPARYVVYVVTLFTYAFLTLATVKAAARKGRGSLIWLVYACFVPVISYGARPAHEESSGASAHLG